MMLVWANHHLLTNDLKTCPANGTKICPTSYELQTQQIVKEGDHASDECSWHETANLWLPTAMGSPLCTYKAGNWPHLQNPPYIKLKAGATLYMQHIQCVAVQKRIRLDVQFVRQEATSMVHKTIHTRSAIQDQWLRISNIFCFHSYNITVLILASIERF